MDYSNRTALVTGATSGLGFETAAQLADLGYGRVIITGRTQAKSDAARSALQSRTGQASFETLVLDNDRLATVETAAEDLAARGARIDTLILNAGIAPPPKPVINTDGLESTVASTLVGHHLLVLRLLEAGILGPKARIVISASEAARDDVPTFHPLDVRAFAADHFDGRADVALKTYMRMKPPARYRSGDVYATAKQFVVWWAAELAKRPPAGMTVNAVSPGSTPGTDADRNMPFYMKYLMVPIFKLIPGMSHSVAEGAARYIEATTFDDDVSGQFFASPPKKMTGPLSRLEYEHLDQPELQASLWEVTSELAGVSDHASW